MIRFRSQLRVLFLCTANVCRSPLAEALLRHRLRARGLGGRVQVRSAGCCVAQSGRRPDPRIQKLAAREGFAIGRIRARQLKPGMIEYSDSVWVMERSHLDHVARLYDDGNVPDKVQLLGSLLASADNHDSDIRDPYFGDWQGFVDAFDLIDSALDPLCERIERQLAGG